MTPLRNHLMATLAHTRLPFILAAALLGPMALGGCVVIESVAKELRATEEVWFEDAYEATLAALGQGGYAVEVLQKDAIQARLETSTPDRRPIRIWIYRRSETKTEFQIRVGRLGEERTSREIMKLIREHI